MYMTQQLLILFEIVYKIILMSRGHFYFIKN